MESVHGVDVSWLHRPQKDGASRPRAPSSPAAPSRDRETLPSPPPPSQMPTRSNSTHENSGPKHIARVNTEPFPASSPVTTPAPASEPAPTPENKDTNAMRSNRRPSILARSGPERSSTDGSRPGRRASWISNISSRFSSTSSPVPSPASPQVSRPIVNGSHATSPGPDLERLASPQLSPNLTRGNGTDELQPYVPQRPRESGSSFFSSITKRLATGGQGASNTRIENGGVCARRTLNVNPSRARCLLPELDHSKLRRVSFSVDVEIASGPRYKDEEQAISQAKKSKDKKVKERAEGEALKNPKAATEIKDGVAEKEGSIDETLAKADGNNSPDEDQHGDEKDPRAMTRKQEKKKKSEEERKERKEKRRKRAEENGTAPIELRDEADSKESSRSVSMDKAPMLPPPTKPSERPTTDPVRIYRRCCQLRESPILKRITEQLMAPNCTDPGDSGTVMCLNLNSSRLQLADFITLGDWLAIVPVRRLLLEDAEITDEGLRVVLAGLLASKKPEPTRTRRSMSADKKPARERAGVIEKLMLKNNPRITRVGWKHLAVFLNMCRSIKAVDVSMIPFPETMPTGRSGQVPDQVAAPATTDAAEIFAKAVAERVAGNKLEELIMSECAMNSPQIQRILEAVTTAGVARIGLAGSHLDQEGFSHVLEYLRSGVCEAIDIGSNDIDKDHMKQLAEALTYKPETPFWGLSIAACNLDPSLLKILLPALAKLPLLRFVDLSHNRALFENDKPEAVQLLRKYLPLLRNLKRFHLMDVGINAKQTIGIAEVLPEGPALAHIGLLENAELSKLVTNTDEASQEEACALYASLMAAVRVSNTIVCIDIDVPAPDNSEVVKALAKQVLAYCLRNMELTPLRAVTHNEPGTLSLDLPEGAPTIAYPDVLQYLVGHVDEFNENNDTPDDDYIVGSTGVVKALQYCLSEAKAQDMRRSSATPATPIPGSGTATPRPHDRDQQAGLDIERSAKAKEMSKSLLGSARKIRGRLQLAIRSGAANGDEMAYRRLLLLDQTLERMIQRFENEFPETRLAAPAPGSIGSADSLDSKFFANSIATVASSFGNLTADIGIQNDSDEDYEGGGGHLGLRASRRGSEVSLASRALSQEEGRVLRFGHELRQDMIKLESAAASPAAAAETPASPPPPAEAWDAERLAQLKQSLDGLTGGEIKTIVEEHSNMEQILSRFGTTIHDLRVLKSQDPQGWEEFVESQLAAKRNTERAKEGLDVL